MPTFKVLVFDNGEASYAFGEYADRAAADQQVAAMIHETFVENGRTDFVFFGSDDLVIVDPENKPVHVWNRHALKSIDDYADYDFKAFLKEASQNRSLLGYQITDLNGTNIHGTEVDPFQLQSFEVLIEGAVLTAKGWAADNDDCLVKEVFRGDIENPTFVTEVTPRDAAAAIGRR